MQLAARGSARRTITKSALTLEDSVVNLYMIEGEAGPVAQYVKINAPSNGAFVGPFVSSLGLNLGVGWISVDTVRDRFGWRVKAEGTPAAPLLTPGLYSATATIADEFSDDITPLVINITVAAAPAPYLALDRSGDSVPYTIAGPNPGPFTVGILNQGTGSLGTLSIDSTQYTGSPTGWATPSIVGNNLVIATNLLAVNTPGTLTCRIGIAGTLAPNIEYYTLTIPVSAPAVLPYIVVSPTTLNPRCVVGTRPAPDVITVSELNGLSLGIVTAIDQNGVPWTTNNIVTGPNNTHLVTVQYPVEALLAGTHTTTLRIASSTAANNYIDVVITLIATVSIPANYPAPRLARGSRAWNYDQQLGEFFGSVFNLAGGYAGAQNGAMPTKTGTVHTVTTLGDWSTTVRPLLVSGGVLDGDVIRFNKALNFVNISIPARPAWTEGTSGFVFMETSGTMPTYEWGSYTAYRSDSMVSSADFGEMVTFSSGTTNVPAMYMQAGANGYWFTGIKFSYTGTNQTQSIIDLGSYNGTVYDPATSYAQERSHIVFDRCFLLNAVGHHIVTVNWSGTRFLAFYHCGATTAIATSTGAGTGSFSTYEPKAFLWASGTGKADFLGNKMGGWGMAFLTGGSVPRINGSVPRDIFYAYNNNYIDHAKPNSFYKHDCKNWFELKSGEYITFAYNYTTDLWYRSDQRFLLNFKSGSQGGANYLTSVRHVLAWGNYAYNVGKGLYGIGDVYPASQGATGCDYIEIRHNIAIGDRTKHSSPGLLAENEMWGTSWGRSQGDGIPFMDASDNTFSARADFAELDAANPWSEYSFVRMDNNLNLDVPRYGPVRGNQFSNTGALTRMYGAGNPYSFRGNGFAPPSSVSPGQPTGVTWDATMLASADPNFYLLPGGYAANCRDHLNHDWALKDAHPARTKGVGGTVPGANADLVKRMTTFARLM